MTSANDNAQEVMKRQIQERVRIRDYAELSSEEQAQVDKLMESIDPFDLQSVLSFGAATLDEHSQIVDRIIKELDKHRDFMGQYKHLTDEIVAFQANIQNLSNTKPEPKQETASKKTLERALSVITGFLSKGENTATKNHETPEQRINFTAQMEQKILQASSQRATLEKNIQDALKGLPAMSEAFSQLIQAQVDVFARLELEIIAGQRVGEKLKENSIPAYESTSKEEFHHNRTQAEALEHAYVTLVEVVTGLEGTRLSAIYDAMSFQSRNQNLEKTAVRLQLQYNNTVVLRGKLQILRMTLEADSLQDLIEKAKGLEIHLIDMDTELQLRRAEQACNNDDLKQHTDALQRNFEARREATIATLRAQGMRRQALEENRRDLLRIANQQRDLDQLAPAALLQIESEIAEQNTPSLGKEISNTESVFPKTSCFANTMQTRLWDEGVNDAQGNPTLSRLEANANKDGTWNLSKITNTSPKPVVLHKALSYKKTLQEMLAFEMSMEAIGTVSTDGKPEAYFVSVAEYDGIALDTNNVFRVIQNNRAASPDNFDLATLQRIQEKAVYRDNATSGTTGNARSSGLERSAPRIRR